MNGTKPTMTATLATLTAAQGTHIIVREFRGAQLVLVEYDGRTGYRWTNAIGGHDKAAKYPQSLALHIAEKASREYGARCATLGADGTLTQPGRLNPIRRGAVVRNRMTHAIYVVHSADETSVAYMGLQHWEHGYTDVTVSSARDFNVRFVRTGEYRDRSEQS